METESNTFFFNILKKEVFALSVEKKDFQEATLEWDFQNIVEPDNKDDWTECVCTHPIKQRCIIKNKKNGCTLTVGNCCINHFLPEGNKMVAALRKNKLNKTLIEKANNAGILSRWDYHFIMDVFRKRKFSQKQKENYDRVFKKIFDYFPKVKTGKKPK